MGGKNRAKQRLKVAKLHEKVANQRKDFLHQQSRQIANAYDVAAIEDLNIRGLAQTLNLAKSTYDNGFGMLKTFLAYKLAERYWTCAHCGAELDRDENAAINIKNEGCRVLGIA